MGDNAILVDAGWLTQHRGDPRVVLIDTRAGADYWTGHLEGARHFDPFPFHYYDTTPRGIKEFNAQLEWILSALGIRGDETVVFYEDNAGMRAARGLWMLEYAGHRAVRILDGGLKAMSAAKLEKTAQPVTPTAFKLAPRGETIATVDYIVANLGRPEIQLFDVRSPEEYFAENVRARRGGAIPGAVQLDWTHALDACGRFKSVAELREMFAHLGLDPSREVVTYCQGGYRAAHSYIALRLAGFTRVRNYLASWAEWGNREDLPIERPRRRG
jgi:thiosulfate/3-mercaptopyruvate sulfurtransferase